MNRHNTELNKLIETIQQLRSPNGCPWDKKQNAKSLTKYLIEEVDELLEGIDKDDTANICEEIGDIMYVLIMMTEIFNDQQNFTLAHVFSTINEKLIRRHPHVFQECKVNNEDELRRQWETIKQQEKQNK